MYYISKFLSWSYLGRNFLMSNLEKNKQVKEKRIETARRHKSMRCRVYEIKIKDNKLNIKQRESLNMYFFGGKMDI